MKKIVLLLTAAALFLASCGNSADSSGIGAGLVATAGGANGGAGAAGDTTGSPSSPNDPSGGTGGVTVGPDGTVTISSSKMIYVGEGTETVDAVTYNVKKYAQLVIDDNPYFYTYYKLYYLNGKLRRLYSFDHGIGSEMDYKYDEFVEHQCGEWDVKNKRPTTSSIMIVTSSPIKIYTYYEDGKIESYLDNSSAAYAAYMIAGIIPKCAYEYYPNGATKVYKTYACINTHDLNAAASWALYSKQEYEYHSNGNPKQEKAYSNTNTAKPSEGTMYLSQKTTYTETGKTESSVSYSSEGWETSKTVYAYYDNGNAKTQEGYSNGKLWAKIAYYESGNPQKAESYNSDGKRSQIYAFYDEKGSTSGYISNGSGSSINLSGKQKLAAYYSYTTSGTGTTSQYIQNIAYYYNSGYLKYYYMGFNLGDGTFYTYADNKTQTHNMSLASSQESFTQEQAEAKLAELLNE